MEGGERLCQHIRVFWIGKGSGNEKNFGPLGPVAGGLLAEMPWLVGSLLCEYTEG